MKVPLCVTTHLCGVGGADSSVVVLQHEILALRVILHLHGNSRHHLGICPAYHLWEARRIVTFTS